MRKKMLKRLLVLTLILSVFMQGVAMLGYWTDAVQVSAAKKKKTEETKKSDVPGIDSEVSVANGMDILMEYDLECATILAGAETWGGHNSLWFYGKQTNAEGINEALLMEYPGYTKKITNWGDDHIASKYDHYYKDIHYLGGTTTYGVNLTEVFKTEEWSGKLPDYLQGKNYRSYVSTGSTKSANTNGAYGLLSEFVAACWALNSQISMYEYYKSQPFGIKTWGTYVKNCEKDIANIYEFRYYLLGYLEYASRNYPEIWNKIVNNETFAAVYAYMENKSEKLIDSYLESQDEIIKLGEAEGCEVEISGGYISITDSSVEGNDESGYGMFDDWFSDSSWIWSDDFGVSSSLGGKTEYMGTDTYGMDEIAGQIYTDELQAQEKILIKTYKQSVTSEKKINKKKAKFTASDGSVYKVTQAGKSNKAGKVQYVKSPLGAVSVNIPSVITFHGIKYSVVSIASEAFADNKSITNVRIGENVTSIGKKAFYNCSKLTSLKIDSSKLSQKNVEKGSFSKGSDKLVITVPSKCVDSYKKVFESAGISKKAKIKKMYEADFKALETKHQYYKNVSSDQASEADKIAKLIADTVMNDPSLTSDLQRVQHAAVYVTDFAVLCVYGSDSNKYYRTPYGVFVSGNHTCAGDTRAMGRVLDYMVISWEHVNENVNGRHQWCVFEMDGITGFADGGAGVADYGEYKSGMQAPDGSYIIFPE